MNYKVAGLIEENLAHSPVGGSFVGNGDPGNVFFVLATALVIDLEYFYVRLLVIPNVLCFVSFKKRNDLKITVPDLGFYRIISLRYVVVTLRSINRRSEFVDVLQKSLWHSDSQSLFEAVLLFNAGVQHPTKLLRTVLLCRMQQC